MSFTSTVFLLTAYRNPELQGSFNKTRSQSSWGLCWRPVLATPAPVWALTQHQEASGQHGHMTLAMYKSKLSVPRPPHSTCSLLVKAHTGPPRPCGQHHSADSAHLPHSPAPRQEPSGAPSSRPCSARAPRRRLSSPLSPDSSGSIPETSQLKGRETTGEAQPPSKAGRSLHRPRVHHGHMRQWREQACHLLPRPRPD